MGVSRREGWILPDGVNGIQLAGKREVSVEVRTEYALQWPLRNGLKQTVHEVSWWRDGVKVHVRSGRRG